MKYLSRMLCTLALTSVLAAMAGCADREGKTVRYQEEQREGEVREEPQGEMVVE